MKYLQGRFSVAVGGKEYRDGWEAIFGKKEEPAPTPEERRAALKELTQLTEEYGGYDAEVVVSPEPVAQGVQLPGGGIRMPRV